jgi:predicted Zn finger-like uncharacterized protein
MIVSCEQCQARFKLADEKLKAEGTKVRCSKCQSIFTVFPPPPAEPAVPVDSPSGPEGSAAEAGFEPAAPDPTPEMTGYDFGAEEPSAPVSGFSTAMAADPDVPPGDFDFDSAFSEEAADPRQDQEPAEFAFGASDPPPAPAADSPVTAGGEFAFAEDLPGDAPPGEFAFDESPATEEAWGEFDFSAEAQLPAETGEAATPGEFDLSPEGPAATVSGEFDFGEEGDGGFSFGEQPRTETSGFGEADSQWGASTGPEMESFDFEEPQFETVAETSGGQGKDTGSTFGEIDFSDEDEDETTRSSFDREPNFSSPPPTRAEPFVPSLPPMEAPAPPPPRQPASRSLSEDLVPPSPRRSPVSTMVVGLIVLLVALCAAGGYLYMSGYGERLLHRVVMKVKGEQTAGPVEQLIGLTNIATSYIDNREAGQLLVVQGTAVNNFTVARSAIAIKGLLLDAAGKTLQQQTVFCGNYLADEKLRTLPYAAIEEAMSNQFGDSLSNMNVKPGAALKFTIVFRNVPSEIANITFEVVDSKPGSR